MTCRAVLCSPTSSKLVGRRLRQLPAALLEGLSLLANYMYAKDLSNAPDFCSPMFESSIPQNSNDLNAEKGPACDIQHGLALKAVYAIPGWNHFGVWRHGECGYPAGENPIRANYTGQPVFGPGTRIVERWFNPEAFATPAACTFGNAGPSNLYDPGRATADAALAHVFTMTERIRFQIRGELFNALNHTNLDAPNRFVNEPQFGTITMAATPGGSTDWGDVVLLAIGKRLKAF